MLNSLQELEISKKTKAFQAEPVKNVSVYTILVDFHDIKDKFDQNKGTLTTLTVPYAINGCIVTLRDTMVLAPGPSASLSSIGDFYNIPKVNIPQKAYNDMASFAKSNPVVFKNYAITDSLICLVQGVIITTIFI
jgi:hypothetical protein